MRNRAGGIRTRDLLNPIQALYQAEPRPVFSLLELNGTPANAIAFFRVTPAGLSWCEWTAFQTQQACARVA